MNTPHFLTTFKSKKVLWLIFVIVIILVPYLLGQFFARSQKQKTLTIPVIPIPTASTKEPTTPLDTTNPFNPNQKLNFNWGSLTADFPPTFPNYISSISLINSHTITSMANKFGFTALEQSPYSDEDGYLWLNDTASLFGSPKQNQILFSSKSSLSDSPNNISKEEAVSLTRSVMFGLFGESLGSTLSTSPEVQYLLFSPNGNDEEPVSTTPEKANLINVNYQQLIDNHPLLSLSSKGETFSVAMDTSKKIYRLNVYGGYQSLSQKGEVPVPSLSDLIEVAPNRAMRISHSESIEAESGFTNASVVNITVQSVELGYFQREDQSIFPVFIIKGNMSARGLNPFPAIYIVPITSE